MAASRSLPWCVETVPGAGGGRDGTAGPHAQRPNRGSRSAGALHERVLHLRTVLEVTGAAQGRSRHGLLAIGKQAGRRAVIGLAPAGTSQQDWREGPVARREAQMVFDCVKLK